MHPAHRILRKIETSALALLLGTVALAAGAQNEPSIQEMK